MPEFPPPSYSEFENLSKYVLNRISAAERIVLQTDLQASIALDARLAAQNVLDDLRDGHSKLTDALKFIYSPGSHRNTLWPPITRLPLDVLAEIFSWAPSWYHPTTIYAPDVPHPAFAIASVCRSWRSVAMLKSALWAKLRIVFDPDTDDRIPDLLSAILDRCKTPEIELALVSTPGSNWYGRSSITSALSKVFSRSRRISLSWGDTSISFVGSLLPLLLSKMPKLEEFSMAQNDQDPAFYSFTETPTLKLLTLCPNLVILDLGHIPFSALDISSLPKIEVFHTSCILRLRQVRQIGAAWPNLSEFTNQGVRLDTQTLDSLPVFPKLIVLSCFNTGDSLLSFIPTTHLPAVKDLHLEVKTRSTAVAFSALLDSSPWYQLRTLTLAGQQNLISILPCLRQLPGITEMRLVRVQKTYLRSIFQEWKEVDVTCQPPRLRCLKFVSCPFGEGAIHALLLFLSHRNQGAGEKAHTPINKIVIMYEPFAVIEGDRFPDWMVPRVIQVVKDVSIVEMRHRIFSAEI